jgi:hypothetical protein
MKNDGLHKMINKAKLRPMLLRLEALSIAEFEFQQKTFAVTDVQ